MHIKIIKINNFFFKFLKMIGRRKGDGGSCWFWRIMELIFNGQTPARMLRNSVCGVLITFSPFLYLPPILLIINKTRGLTPASPSPKSCDLKPWSFALADFYGPRIYSAELIDLKTWLGHLQTERYCWEAKEENEVVPQGVVTIWRCIWLTDKSIITRRHKRTRLLSVSFQTIECQLI